MNKIIFFNLKVIYILLLMFSYSAHAKNNGPKSGKCVSAYQLRIAIMQVADDEHYAIAQQYEGLTQWGALEMKSHQGYVGEMPHIGVRYIKTDSNVLPSGEILKMDVWKECNSRDIQELPEFKDKL